MDISVQGSRGDRIGIASARTVPEIVAARDPLVSSLSASYAGVVAFIAVATEGSFARAGDRLGIGRSAVSRSVQKLENQLGTRLFQRTTRATSLTREGERFFENCRPGVERILQALEEMRDLREGPPQGLVRVQATLGFGRRVIAPLLAAFRARFHEVAVELLLDDHEPDLIGERIDVAFRDGVLNDSQVIGKKLIPMKMLVCASPSYAQRRGLPRSPEDIHTHTWINQRLPKGQLRGLEFKANGRTQRIAPWAGLTFNDPELVLQAVLAGEGLGQLPSYLFGDAVRVGSLVTCLEQFSPEDAGHHLCYLSRRQLPKRIRAFIDFMTTQIRALDFDGSNIARSTGQSLQAVALTAIDAAA